MINRLLKFIIKDKITITDKQYQTFIDTGYVSDDILEMIADKVMDFSTLTEYEYSIFVSLTSQIESIISIKNKL